MKVQNVLKKRGKSLIAATGIAAVVMLNGLGGGVAGANQAPPVTCEYAPSAQSQSGVVTGSAAGGFAASTDSGSGSGTTSAPGTQTIPSADAKPAEPGVSGESTASGSGAVTAQSGQATNASPETQTVPDQAILNTAESCVLQDDNGSSQSISVEVCVSSNEVVVGNAAPTTEFNPGPGGETKPGDGASTGPVSPEAGAGSAGVAEAKPSEGGTFSTFEDGPVLGVVQGEFANGGVVATSSSTCVSVTVTDGVPSITVQPMEPGVVMQGGSNDPNDPNAGRPATGEAVPAQPGTTTTPQPDPFATPPAPGA